MIRQRPLALTATIAFTVVAAGFGLATPQRAEAAAPPTVDPVIEWNRTLLQLIRTPGVQPATVHPTRNLAIMHLAIYDAVDAIERIGAPYAKGIAAGKHASAVAAADQAAHDTLVALYPTHRADLDSELRDDLTKIRNSSAEPARASPSYEATGSSSGTPMIERILIIRRDSTRETCIWLVPIFSAISA